MKKLVQCAEKGKKIEEKKMKKKIIKMCEKLWRMC